MSPVPRRYRGERRPRMRSPAFAGRRPEAPSVATSGGIAAAGDNAGGRAERACRTPKDPGYGVVYDLRRFKDGAEGGIEGEPA